MRETNIPKYFNKEIYDDILGGTNIVSGNDYRTIMCTISQLASDMVVKTLGPYGSTTMIDDGGGFSYPTKDGWSALAKLRFSDPLYNTAFNLLKQVSFNAVSSSGDGTTTAMVTANAFLQRIMASDLIKESDFNQALFRECVNEAAEEIIHTVDTRAVDIDREDFDTIERIAYVAANGNAEFAKIIRNIYAQTKNPNIHVQIDSGDSVTYDIESGYKIECSPLNFPVYINTEEKSALFKHAHAVIFDHNLTYVDHGEIIGALSQYASKIGTSMLVIMAPYVDEIIARSIHNQVMAMSQKGMIPNIMLMQVPVTTALQKLSLKDIAVLTNATIMDAVKMKIFNTMVYNAKHPAEPIDDRIVKEEGLNYETPEDVIVSCIGNMATFEVTDKVAFIRDFEGIVNETTYRALIDDAYAAYNDRATAINKSMNYALDKEYRESHMRYVKLLGKVGVIKVGGASDLQRRCDKDTLDDAVLACRSAYLNGYVCGMNLDTLWAIDRYIKKTSDHTTTRERYCYIAACALHDAFFAASLAVLENKYPEGTIANVADKNGSCQEMSAREILSSCMKLGLSFDIRSDRFVGENFPVINSVITDIEIIRATVSVLSLVITSNQLLSMTKMYDKKMSRTTQLTQLNTTERVKGRGFMQGMLDALSDEKNSQAVELLGEVFTSKSSFFEALHTYEE